MNNEEEVNKELDPFLEDNTVVLYLTEDGSLVIISNGKMNIKQERIITKMLTCVSKDSSFILKFILYLEILFQNTLYKIKKSLKK